MGNWTAINVKSDYGAAGDGITDDTTAIQNALDNVQPGSSKVYEGGTVFFPQGTYLVSDHLLRKVSFTRCVGEGRTATTIKLDASNWKGTPSPLDSTKSFIFDHAANVSDCTVMDMQIDGDARDIQATSGSALYGGISCTKRNEILRVSLYDIWGWALWLFGQNSDYTKIIDCDADGGQNAHGNGGNDCIGGGPLRAEIVRFLWKVGMLKNTALDFTTSNGSEVSCDLIECVNESPQNVSLEGPTQTSIIACRFYGGIFKIKTDGEYAQHLSITNPSDVLVADSLFAGATCRVTFDGGDNADLPDRSTNKGGRIAIIGNTFVDTPSSSIQWAGDDTSTSFGGSIIANNRIFNPNQSGSQDAVELDGDFGSLGTMYGSGISVLASYGLTISDNTIDDTQSNMLYSMQLTRADGPQPGATGRILVKGNQCGNAPNVGNGSAGTFYIGSNPTGTNPWPILLNNTNQKIGYDGSASSAINKNAAWPGSPGYPYNAFICLSGNNITLISLGGDDTGRTDGSFYLPVGESITINWSGGTRPTINVFRS